MADPNLTESAWQKAKDDAWGVIKSPIFELGAAMVGLVFGAAALIASEGQPGTTQAGSAVFFGVLSFAITLTLIFLVQLAAAPVRQRNALRENWPSTSDEPNGDITVKLWNAYRKGRDLSQQMEGIPARARNWQAADAWAEETANLLDGNVPEEKARAFFSAGEFEEDLVHRMDDRISELHSIIEGLG